ncbi:hypothetical protein RJT34_03204 [Clitoria ternatea]|uniref:Uncharacterized protein n=1 Tax=Clitoria ternatea TaxID=43366 RepID=A0AAN9KLT1_CLITE
MKSTLNHLEDKERVNVDAISSQLHLKSSSSFHTLNKQLVLQCIRHYKSLNRIKSAFEGLLGSHDGNTTAAQQQKWLQQHDTFSSP